MLIVIAIIAVLSGLLLPALSHARKAGHRVKCVNNLRQFGLAVQMYWDDHEGRSFRYLSHATNGGKVYWFGWIQDGAEGARDFDAAQGALYPYLLGRGVELCPSLDYSLGDFKLKAKGASYGYGYNLSFSSSGSQAPFNLNKVSRPSEVAVFADAAQVNFWQPPASMDNPMLEEWYYIATNEPTVHFRHAQKANAVFCDGHVALEKPLPGSVNPLLPHHYVGSLRPELLTP